VRTKRSELGGLSELSLVYAGAADTLESCIKERLKRYKSFAKQWDAEAFKEDCMYTDAPELGNPVDWKPELEYDEWVWALSDKEKAALHDWLVSCAEMIRKGL
jgi:hypothetical protein